MSVAVDFSLKYNIPADTHMDMIYLKQSLGDYVFIVMILYGPYWGFNY
jgi:hypothetical protein